MSCCVREDYLRRFTNQTRTTNPITVMNRSLAPDTIHAMQQTFINIPMKTLYANPDHAYIDILHLCLWANEVHIWTRIDWLAEFCMFGNSFQDLVNQAFEAEHRGRPRRPLVALVAGQWCVVEGTNTLYLCRTTLEAIALWMLIMWTSYDCKTTDHMSVYGFLLRCFEPEPNPHTLTWLTPTRKVKWKARLQPGDTTVVWTRPPSEIRGAARAMQTVNTQ
jgi:hypothetical protein